MKRTGNRNSKKVEINGVKFDSILESRFYLYLLQKQEEGIVKEFTMQAPFTLVDACTTATGKQLKIGYVADFVVTLENGGTLVLDTKGHCDAVAKIKRKLFLARYPLPLYYIGTNTKWLGLGVWAGIDVPGKIAKRGKTLADFRFNGLFYF